MALDWAGFATIAIVNLVVGAVVIVMNRSVMQQLSLLRLRNRRTVSMLPAFG